MCESGNSAVGNREQFCFIEIVRLEFSWLSMYGFTCTKEDPTFVRYESETSYLNVYHGRLSYEIAAEYGCLNHPSQSYPVSALIRLSNFDEAEKYRNYVAIEPGSVVVGVKSLSDTLRKHSKYYMDGTPKIFQKLEYQRLQSSRKFADKVLSRQIRPKAEKAFQEKSYAEAAKFYESIESELTATELKKLEYCRRHL